MIDKIYKDAELRMKKTTENFEREITHLRTGRASPYLLDGVKVDYYGTQVPINQIATIQIPEASLIIIQPWDKSIIGEIERAIKKTGLGLNPQSDGNVLRIPIPPLSEERRQELIKIVRKYAEDARVAIRNVRRDCVEQIKKLEKNKEISEDDSKKAEKHLQEIHDKFVEEINDLVKNKEKELLEE
ncbi:MAG TPA: ribosome recycling factor [Candidatus Hydrothermia bacterium]|nr:ribosome recycling factor [Candidatus Hydrothermia bacterium]